MFGEPSLAAAAVAYLEESAPVVALHLDRQAQVVAASARARALLGDGLVGCRFQDLAVGFIRSPGLDERLAQTERAHRVTVTTTAGLPETLYFRFFPVPDGTLALGSLDLEEQGRLRRELLALNRELNVVTRELHQANAELRDLNALKSRFLGMAAHDLRVPIGVILAYAGFVLDEAGDRLDEEQRSFLRICLTAGANMKQLVDNFLHVAVVDSGHLQIERTRADLEEIFTGVTTLVQVGASRKGVELDVATPEGLPPLWVDVPKLQQVLVNLVTNAVEHSDSGGRVRVRASWEPPAVLFSVRDEGPGIDPDLQERLFAPFAAAGTRKTAGERSVGLGLTIARQVVEAHGGRIWVETDPGRGATFWVQLPAAQADPPADGSRPTDFDP